MPIARDESLAPPVWPLANRNIPGYKPPQVIQDSTFDTGFDGFAQHGNSTDIQPQLSLTDWRTWPGSKHGLLVSLSNRPYQTWGLKIMSGTSTAMQRGSFTFPMHGLIQELFWYVVWGTDTDVSPRTLWMQGDLEDWDSQYRAIPSLRCQRVTGSLSGGTLEQRDEWTMNDDSNTPVVIHTGHVLGRNENKMGWEFGGYMVDLDMYEPGEEPAGDGCPWGIREAYIGNATIGLNGPGQPQVGRGKRNPQGNTGVGMYTFNGGFNRGIGVQNNTTELEPGRNGLILLRSLTLWHEPALEG